MVGNFVKSKKGMGYFQQKSINGFPIHGFFTVIYPVNNQILKFSIV
jgi:hypothetical protein